MSEKSLGIKLKEEGMNKSRDNADRRIVNWSISAYNLLKVFVNKRVGTFKAEDIRKFATTMGLEEPPSNRAWGSLIIKARNEDLIEMVGYSQVDNPKAHRANASVWRTKCIAEK